MSNNAEITHIDVCEIQVSAPAGAAINTARFKTKIVRSIIER